MRHMGAKIIMAWLTGIVVLILLVIFPGFRKVAGGLIALAVVVGGFFYLQIEREESRSRSRITNSELVFENVALKPDYSSYKLVGRIKNNSAKYTLKQVTFVVTMQDCAGESRSPQCITIGESNETLYLSVPHGQARDFDEAVYFSDGILNPKGHLEWNYSVSQIKGE